MRKLPKITADERINQIVEETSAAYVDECASSYREEQDAALALGGSPIEKLMALGLVFAISSKSWHGGSGNCNWYHSDFSDTFEVISENFTPETAGIDIWPEVAIGHYRMDFLVCFAAWNGGYIFGAIECDGHDHHDLTKEQAVHDRTRDRFFQRKGLLILRFTGSEIWHSPVKCATDALNILDHRVRTAPSHRWRRK